MTSQINNRRGDHTVQVFILSTVNQSPNICINEHNNIYLNQRYLSKSQYHTTFTVGDFCYGALALWQGRS